MTSIHDANLSGQDTYELTVPQSIVKGDGYFSITVYDGDSKLLIPNDLGVCDRTTYSAEPESDGTYRIIISISHLPSHSTTLICPITCLISQIITA